MNIPVDTLRPDTFVLHAMQRDEQYNYARELAQSDSSLSDWIMRRVAEFLNELLGYNVNPHTERIFWLTIATFFVVAVMIFVFVKYRHLHVHRGQMAAEEVPEADTIYGIDFEERIAEAMRMGNHREAVRLIYLQTLRRLSDTNNIDWQIFKTPTQYTYEVKTQAFRLFTNHFLRVRYGDFSADMPLVDEMGRLQKQIYAELQMVPETSGQKGGMS